jgi:hypothetical protein
MEHEQQTGDYQANDAEALVGEIFSGGLTVGDAIERLRTRLLDLSARNRLLNYRHPKGRCVQIADEPSINLVFNRVYVDSKGVPFKYVPEPLPATYEGRRPEARLYAQRLGISTSFEFEPNPAGSNGRRLHGMQTLLYPADLERQLRKIAGEAKTAIEETGTNMLFLVFGFLEFYDSEDSDRPMLAPLISLPVTLVRGEIDRETRTYQYTVQYNGEDLAENHTLREKLRRDFILSIPEFGEEDEPETYFASVEEAVKNKRGWKVRRQITLGMLSFGKLALWADLDTKKNAGLAAHELIKSVFSGGSSGSGDGLLHAEDYRIDERPEASQPLIYDADSSQHSAIIDVLSGKNLVVNGPPGTGKSQTITNIIAAALSKGKKVLFVSEKLAALEVVRHRLNQAGLGHFCLELHSHKTQKKKFLEDLQARIEERFPAPAQFQSKLGILKRQKAELARYAELMGSKVGNALGMTVNEVFWAAERRRQELGDLAAQVNAIGFPDALQWTHDDIECRGARLAGLAEIHDAIGEYGPGHPWWGFQPNPLAPSDDEAIARTALQALDHARSAEDAADEAVAYFGFREQPDAAAAAKARVLLASAPEVPEGMSPKLLSRMFDDSDPKGQRSSRLISDVAHGVTTSRSLFESAGRVLADGTRLAPEDVDEARTIAEKRYLSKQLLSADISLSIDAVRRLEKAVESLEATARVANPAYGPLGTAVLDAFITATESPFISGLSSFQIGSVSERAASVSAAIESLSGALSRIETIVTRRSLPFDFTPNSIAKLADPDGLPGLARGVPVDEAVLVEARRYAAFVLSDKPVTEMVRLKSLLESQVASWTEAVGRCRTTAQRVGLGFDSSKAAVTELVALSKVAVDAPGDLLEYRGAAFGHPRTAELIGRIRAAIGAEREGRTSFGKIFYLDALPPVEEIKSAVALLRSKDGLFAFFDGNWRKSKRLHTSLCKEKRKLGSRQRAEELAGLAAWIEARDAFVADAEVKAAFGGLFRGLDTNPDAVRRLYEWYQAARSTMVVCPGLTAKVDLTSIPAELLAELATKAGQVGADAEYLEAAAPALRCLLGADIAGFHDGLSKGWDPALGVLNKAVEKPWDRGRLLLEQVRPRSFSEGCPAPHGGEGRTHCGILRLVGSHFSREDHQGCWRGRAGRACRPGRRLLARRLGRNVPARHDGVRGRNPRRCVRRERFHHGCGRRVRQGQVGV